MKSERRAPSIMIGHSLGGAAVFQASNRIDSLKAVVTIGAPSNPAHVKGILNRKKRRLKRPEKL